jgi:hypothetical protein
MVVCAGLFLSACQTTASVVGPATSVFTQPVQVGDRDYPVRIDAVSTDETGRLSVTFAGFGEAEKDREGAIPGVAISINGKYIDGKYLDPDGHSTGDGKITYYFDTGSAFNQDDEFADMLFLFAPDQHEKLDVYKTFDLASKKAVDFFAPAEEGVDIYTLYRDGRIGLEILGLDDTSNLSLKIWNRTSDDITVKIDYGTWFATGPVASQSNLKYQYQTMPGNSEYALFQSNTGYRAIHVDASGGSGTQAMAARKRYALKLDRSRPYMYEKAPQISFSPQSNGILVAYETVAATPPQSCIYTISIPVVCMDREKETPTGTDIFTPQPPLPNTGFVALLRELDARKSSPEVSQFAVWIVQEYGLDKMAPGEVIEYAEKILAEHVNDLLDKYFDELIDKYFDELIDEYFDQFF